MRFAQALKARYPTIRIGMVGDGDAGPVLVEHAVLELVEPQAALGDPPHGLLLAHEFSPSERAISMSCTSVVPSPISRIFESR